MNLVCINYMSVFSMMFSKMIYQCINLTCTDFGESSYLA
jgi:hypothetical protein